jgi:hypothetical protein
MAMEMQAVEHDIAKLANANAALDEKGMGTRTFTGQVSSRRLRGLLEQCNHALRK